MGFFSGPKELSPVFRPNVRVLLGGAVKNTKTVDSSECPPEFMRAFLNRFRFLQSTGLSLGAADQFSPEGKK